MSFTITIEGDGRIEADHNSGEIIWSHQAHPGNPAWDRQFDEYIARDISLFLATVVGPLDCEFAGVEEVPERLEGDSR